MRIVVRLFILSLALLMTSPGGGRPSLANQPEAGRDDSKRIRFSVRTVEEESGNRNVISETVIEGPPGTDFNINLQSSRFKMGAKFLTDMVGATRLRARARINTRRFYGYSENKLPIYEEDTQEQAIELGFDEEMVLLPFGQGGGASVLKIEITPSIADKPVYSMAGRVLPLEIDIVKQSPGGSINVQAFKMPHNFEVEATLVEDGREVARATADCLIEDKQELLLAPQPGASAEVINNPLAVSLTLSQYMRSRPADEIAIDFSVSRINRQGENKQEVIASNWAGIGALGSTLKYNLSDYYLKATGKNYELRFTIKLAKGETAD
jgi:hypothetical protein